MNPFVRQGSHSPTLRRASDAHETPQSITGILDTMEPSIRILVEHSIGKAEARRRLRNWIEKIQQEALPAGIELSDFYEGWAENVLQFSFRLHKRFLSAPVTGMLTIHELEVALDFNLPEMVRAFVSRSTIEETLEQMLRKVLSSSSNDSKGDDSDNGPRPTRGPHHGPMPA